MILENHLRIAPQVVVLHLVVVDDNEEVSVTRLSNVFNGQGHVSLHGEADSGISGEQRSKGTVAIKGLTPEAVVYGPHGEDGMIVRTTDFKCRARSHHLLHRTIFAMDEKHQVDGNQFFSLRIKAPAITVRFNDAM